MSLTIENFKALSSRHAFSDFLPYLECDEKEGIFLLTDGVGFVLEAAGLPGTSHDTWNQLKCIYDIDFPTNSSSEVATLAELVGLPPELLARFPHQLSGGQKARVGIARAIAVKPRLLVLDEPTSALDVSVQALILRLLADLKARLNMSYLFVSHDLNVVRLLCDRVIVMYLGKIVEAGPAAEIFSHPHHPYTQALVSAIPQIGAAVQRPRVRLEGEPRSPIDPSPMVCRFFGRCPRGEARCGETMPALIQVGPAHTAACHFATASP